MTTEEFDFFKAHLERIRYPNFFGYTFTQAQIDEVKEIANKINSDLTTTIKGMTCRLHQEWIPFDPKSEKM